MLQMSHTAHSIRDTKLTDIIIPHLRKLIDAVIYSVCYLPKEITEDENSLEPH